MLGTSIASRFRAAAGRFAGDIRGNIAVIFIVALVPIISFVGAAIDYSRANRARSTMHAALDATALMRSKDLSTGAITTAQISTKAQSYFSAMYTDVEAGSISINASYNPASGSGSTIMLTGSGMIATDFMKVVGFPDMNFNAASTTSWGNVRMRVAMALDNTGSMADDGKMPALQNAAKNLIDQLSALVKNPGDIYISIIPFAKDVNVGPSNYNQNWVDFTAWDAANGSNVCTARNSSGHCTQHTWTPNNHNTWNGCVWDRDQDYDTLNTAPTLANPSTLFPAEQWASCPLQLMPLSYDWTALKNLITNMTPNGNTNQSIGMAWAWQSLAQTSPLNAPSKDPNYTYKDAIILLSDGLNTQDRWYTSASQIDARQRILCDNAKAQGITVYTIQLNTSSPPDPTSAVLAYCASGSTNFYVVNSATQTLSVFNSIGTSLSQLRLTN